MLARLVHGSCWKSCGQARDRVPWARPCAGCGGLSGFCPIRAIAWLRIGLSPAAVEQPVEKVGEYGSGAGPAGPCEGWSISAQVRLQAAFRLIPPCDAGMHRALRQALKKLWISLCKNWGRTPSAPGLECSGNCVGGVSLFCSAPRERRAVILGGRQTIPARHALAQKRSCP